MLHRQPTIEEMRAALEASAREMTPIQHFERMVRMGLVNRKGQLTKRYGGEGELDPDADPLPTDIANKPNGDH